MKQSIEIDTIAFAYHQMKDLFDVEVKNPEDIKLQINIKVIEIEPKLEKLLVSVEHKLGGIQ